MKSQERELDDLARTGPNVQAKSLNWKLLRSKLEQIRPGSKKIALEPRQTNRIQISIGLQLNY